MSNKRERTRSRSPIRRGGGDRRFGGRRERNNAGCGKLAFNHNSDKLVYFSNLPYEMTWMELKDLVREQCGEVNFIETIDGRDGRPTGCAVVDFKSRDSAAKCLEVMHRQEVRGRSLIAKEIRDPIIFFRKIREETGVDFLGSRDRQTTTGTSNHALPQRVSTNASENETYGLSESFLEQLNIKLPLVDRIFITNISFGCGVGRLFDICSLAGKVVWLDLQLDPDGKSKGMAIVQYSHPIEAVQAISMLNNQRIYDRAIAVKMDRFDKKEERREGELPPGLRGIGMGLGANGAPLADVASVISSISNTSAPLPIAAAVMQQPTPSLSMLNAAQMANPFAAGALPAASLSSPYTLQMQQQQLVQPFSDSNSPGNGSLPFGDVYTRGAVSTTKQPFYGPNGSNGLSATCTPSNLFNSNKGPLSTVNSAAFGGRLSNEGVLQYNGGGSSYDTSRIILIKNLPMDYTWQIVSDRVQQFGDLESVEMVSPGVAKVRFLQIADATRAKQTLQGTTVEGRVIGIEFL